LKKLSVYFFTSLFLMLGFCSPALANEGVTRLLSLVNHPAGYLSIAVFVTAYILVMAEEFSLMRKSKPVVLAAGIIWVIIATVYARHGFTHAAENAVRQNILEFAELMLFLLVAMTYINSLEERRAFEALRFWLVSKGFTYRQMFWFTGILALFLSPVADNLTTALVMCSVVMAVGSDNSRFVGISCINIVVAANAGGAFSPFGDITTLMVWQKGIVSFWTFFFLFIPSMVNFLVPAIIMHFAVPSGRPEAPEEEVVLMKRGAKRIMVLFLLTIITAVSFHNFLHLPPMLGMMTGLAYLQLFGYYLKLTHNKRIKAEGGDVNTDPSFDIFRKISRAEWDTLLFFYGVILCVGGLGFIGYLNMASEIMYGQWGPTFANTVVGLLSSIVDNIPVMFAVLSMNPEMTQGQWLLVTLTAGVGGSLLSIGSAAGVALMGHAKGKYTFFGHLKWTPVIALGYGASILVHLWLNASLF